MASSDNLMAMDPSWMFRNAFPETWLPDTFSRETETLAKALQKSFETQTFDNMNFNTEFMSPWLNTSDTTTAVSVQTSTQTRTPTQTPTVSGGSAENETFSAVAAVVTSKQRKNGVATAAAGKISKRKSRASKRSTTTFINADAANFRQLVQQITGVKFGSAGNGLTSASGGQLLKPEPRRVNRLQLIGGGGGLPTLDTSAFLLDPNHQTNQNYRVGFASALFRQQQVTVGVSPPSAVAVDGGAASPSQFDFDSFCSFPTLESWKAV